MTEKNLGGRPLKFSNPQSLSDKVNEYFSITPSEQVTLTGLCLALNTTKETLDDYKVKEGYEDIVKMAKLRVEHAYELSLRKNGRAGDIFGLKNMGWADKTETEHSGNILDAIYALVSNKPAEIPERRENP